MRFFSNVLSALLFASTTFSETFDVSNELATSSTCDMSDPTDRCLVYNFGWIRWLGNQPTPPTNKTEPPLCFYIESQNRFVLKKCPNNELIMAKVVAAWVHINSTKHSDISMLAPYRALYNGTANLKPLGLSKPGAALIEGPRRPDKQWASAFGLKAIDLQAYPQPRAVKVDFDNNARRISTASKHCLGATRGGSSTADAIVRQGVWEVSDIIWGDCNERDPFYRKWSEFVFDKSLNDSGISY